MKIEIIDLHKSFGSLKIYNGLNLTIEQGDLVIIMGRSGEGKSVLLKHLVGLLKPDKGQILIDGKDITRLNEREMYGIRMRFGMVFQNGGMLQSLNVGENVALPELEVKGKDLKDVMRRVSEKLKMVGMEGKENQNVATLSGGQRKRVAIARGLLQEADCLLFDEPTAGLDPPISETIDEVIEKVNKETGATCIVVTHDLVSAFSIGKKLHLLHDHKIIMSGTADEFRETDNPVVKDFLARGRAI